MSLHPAFPTSPYTILDPAVCWLPGDGATSPEKLLPPLVARLRRKVKAFRDISRCAYRTMCV
jgi:type III restriction enzyme